MQITQGMNIEAVRGIGRQLASEATALEGVRARVDALTSQASQEWRGLDSQQFNALWRSGARARMVMLIQGLQELAHKAAVNAHGQEGTSSSLEGGGSSAGAISANPGVDGSDHSAAHSNDAAGAPTSAQRASQGFVDRFKGTMIDYDSAHKAQCFDVFRQYNESVLGLDRATQAGIAHTSDKASDIYNHYDSNGVSNHYERIPYGQGAPQAGDIVVYGATDKNSFGHVALVTGVNGDTYSVLEQNYSDPANPRYDGSVPAAVHEKTLGGGILGYLRPKQVLPTS